MVRPATRGAGGEPNSTSDASQHGLVQKDQSRSIAPRRGAPSPHRVEIRTAAGPSSVVQWVLSGGPYTVSSHTRHTSRWCDHPGNCMADGLQVSAGRDPVTGRTMRRGDDHPLPWTLTAPARRQQPRHKSIPRAGVSGILRVWLQSSSGWPWTSRALPAASSGWSLRQESPREPRQRCPCRLAR
jgi:hypothetical protein